MAHLAVLAPMAMTLGQPDDRTRQLLIVGVVGGLSMYAIDVFIDDSTQLAFSGLGNLAFVWRIQAQLLRPGTRWPSIAVLAFVAWLAGLPLVQQGIQAAAVAPDLLTWDLHAVAIATSFVVFEIATWFIRDDPKMPT